MMLTPTGFADYATARRYLEPFAHTSGLAASPQFALQRAQSLMALLGNPQDAQPVIHLAGTSGKGSTATMLAALLQAHGLGVGLGLSPHVRHLLERIQVNGAPVSEESFCHVLGEMVPTISAMQASEWGAPSFFEIMIALSYTLFAHASRDRIGVGESAVDVVVMETGLGGRYDATNTVTSADKIALITDIGYDHVELLGNSLARIASQKAGIIQPHNRVLTYLQPAEAQGVIEAECAAQSATLATFDPARAIHIIDLQPEAVRFDLTLSHLSLPNLHLPTLHLPDLHLSLAGSHQAHNAGLAVAAAQLFLQGIARELDEDAVRHALAHITLPGRMDQRQWRGATFIIDGAHNAQKMHALCSALSALYPGQRFVFIVSLKQGKEASAIFAQLLPLASHLILTRFENSDQGMTVTAAEPDELAGLLPPESDVPVTVMPNVAAALESALEITLELTLAQAQNSPTGTPAPAPVIITGSLYLLAEVYALLDGASERGGGL